MSVEDSTLVVVSRAALEGALRAALPHVARRIPEDAPDNGAGLLRLAVVQDCVMVLASAIDRKRALAVRFTVLDGDSYGDGVKSMWLRRSAVEALATFLAGSPVERVSLLLDEREASLSRRRASCMGLRWRVSLRQLSRWMRTALTRRVSCWMERMESSIRMRPWRWTLPSCARSRRRLRPGRFLCVFVSGTGLGGLRSSGALMRASGGPPGQCCFRPL